MSKIKTKIIKTRVYKEKLGMEKNVMGKIKSNEIKMKPKWLFIAGSILTTSGLVGLTVGVVFLTNLTVFLIKKRGPGYGRLELMLESFPLWVPILAILGVVLGIWMLKRYDFSYKKNFLLIIFAFISSIIMATFIVDQLGFNDIWSHQGPMRRFYQQVEGQENGFSESPGGNFMRNRGINRYFP